MSLPQPLSHVGPSEVMTDDTIAHYSLALTLSRRIGG